MSFDPYRAGRLISRAQPVLLDVFGPTAELLTVSTGDDGAPGLVRNSLAPGVSVPLHAHADPETIYVLTGRIEVLTMVGNRADWVAVRAGQIFHVPPHARHAVRCVGGRPAYVLTVTTPQRVRLFERVGRPVEEVDPWQQLPPAGELERYAALTSERGDWNGTYADNVAVGIHLPRHGCTADTG